MADCVFEGRCRRLKLIHAELGKSQNELILGWIGRVDAHRRRYIWHRLFGPAAISEDARHICVTPRITGVESDGLLEVVIGSEESAVVKVKQAGRLIGQG